MQLQIPSIQKAVLLLSAALLFQTSAQAQGVGINETNSTPDPSAMLDVQSTTKGLLIPRMTTTERSKIQAPATGLMVFDNTTLSFWYYDGIQWIELFNATTKSSSAGDDLGNHTATANIQTAGNYVSHDGDNEGIYVATDGSVGLGTNSPNYPLDVQAGGANMRVGRAQLGAWPHNTSFAYFAHEDLNNAINGNYALLQSRSGRTFLNAASGWDIRFRINNTDRMILDADGDVGIGTTNPTEKLHVNGSVRIQDGNQQNGYVLTSNADGVGTWTDPNVLGSFSVIGNVVVPNTNLVDEASD